MGRHIRNGIPYGGTVNVSSMIKHRESTVAKVLDDLNTIQLSDTIVSGDTSVTFTDSRIDADTAKVDIYFRDKVLAPTSVTVTDGSITIEIDAQDTDTDVLVQIGKGV